MKDIQHLRTNVICNTPTRLLQRVMLHYILITSNYDNGSVKHNLIFYNIYCFSLILPPGKINDIK